MLRLVLGVLIVVAVAGAQAPQPNGAGVTPGALPDRWPVSGPDCPPIRTSRCMSITRSRHPPESGCSNYEKPLLYLIFGKARILMLDTGAGRTDVDQAVQGVIAGWLKRNGRDAMPLVVAHTHAHGDHISGDAQLKMLPSTTVVGLTPAAVQAFFGFKNWPEEILTFDLGERTIDLIPIPGHEPSSVAFYDRQTGLLFTGDSLYPGRLYVRDGAAFTRSIQRLVDFTRGKIVTHVLGNHIEETRTPYLDYPVGTKYQPDEHVLQLGRAELLELNDALRAMNGTIVRMAMRDFTIWPQ